MFHSGKEERKNNGRVIFTKKYDNSQVKYD